jgi:hypothetical protein
VEGARGLFALAAFEPAIVIAVEMLEKELA